VIDHGNGRDRPGGGKLKEFDFTVRGWSRRPKSEPGIACFSGPDGLAQFMSDVQILVCMLPLTAETAGILNRETFESLAQGACLINAARGAHLVEEDLLATMASGRIAAATLDVFKTEPLPRDHPFWTTRRLFITPHNASLTDFGARRAMSRARSSAWNRDRLPNTWSIAHWAIDLSARQRRERKNSSTPGPDPRSANTPRPRTIPLRLSLEGRDGVVSAIDAEMLILAPQAAAAPCG
jgi:hypothetical protein